MFLTHISSAQVTAQEDNLSLDKGTIDSQFEFLLKKSGNYNNNNISYEVVKRFWVNKIRKNILDTLKLNSDKINELKHTINTQQSETDALKNSLSKTTENLSAVTGEKDNMTILGISLNKGSYNFMVWTIIIVLFIFLLLFIYKFRNSNILTQEARSSLSELESEYEEHRRKALEREQKVRRQLQDELNKQKNK